MGGYPLPIPLPLDAFGVSNSGAYGASVLRPPSTQNPGYASVVDRDFCFLTYVLESFPFKTVVFPYNVTVVTPFKDFIRISNQGVFFNI